MIKKLKITALTKRAFTPEQLLNSSIKMLETNLLKLRDNLPALLQIRGGKYLQEIQEVLGDANVKLSKFAQG